MHEERGSDVAVLKLKEVKREFDYCKFGSIEDIIIGMVAFSISNPLVYEFSFLKGQVSFPCVAERDQRKEVKVKRLKHITYDHDLPLVQLNNVHTKPGSSGGPLFNGKGRVIAMTCFGAAIIDYAIHKRRLREVIAKSFPNLTPLGRNASSKENEGDQKREMMMEAHSWGCSGSLSLWWLFRVSFPLRCPMTKRGESIVF